jgi:hypothetical protein
MKGSGFGLKMLLLVAVAAAVPAIAQSPVELLKVNVPFDFSVAGVTKPAGEYTVASFSTGLVAINSREHGGVFLQIKATKTSGAGHDALVFHKFNDQYFLASIRTSNDSSHRELYPSRQEREKLAQGERAMTTVLMASAR